MHAYIHIIASKQSILPTLTLMDPYSLKYTYIHTYISMYNFIQLYLRYVYLYGAFKKNITVRFYPSVFSAVRLEDWIRLFQRR